jgi:hypothetical protein
MNKQTELNLAKGILDRVAEDYPTMFHEDGFIRKWGCGAMTCPTRVKEELRLVRRLLLEVEKAL